METIKPRTSLKVTINPDVNTNLILSGWPINTDNSLVPEPDRVSIEKNGLSYSFVMGEVIKLECWSIDSLGEPSTLKYSKDIE
jgi:hypothetical protein